MGKGDGEPGLMYNAFIHQSQDFFMPGRPFQSNSFILAPLMGTMNSFIPLSVALTLLRVIGSSVKEENCCVVETIQTEVCN